MVSIPQPVVHGVADLLTDVDDAQVLFTCDVHTGEEAAVRVGFGVRQELVQ